MISVLASKGVFIGFSVATLVATLVVAFGLYLEYEKSEDRQKRIGNMLVVVGVVLEALFGIVAFISADIRESRSELQIATLTLRANQLEKETTDSKLQIASASRDAAKASASVKGAEARIAEANAKIEVARKDAAEANQIAERERFARLTLEKKLAWRSLSPKKQEQIIGKLLPFAGQLFTISVASDDQEPFEFARLIGDMLLRAGWKLAVKGISRDFGLPVNGLLITVGRNPKDIPAGKALVAALGSPDVIGDFRMAPKDRPLSDSIAIVVGVRY